MILILKIIAWALIVFGSLFSIFAIYSMFKLVEWPAIILGYIFLGPLPLATGIMILKYLKSHSELIFGEDMKKL